MLIGSFADIASGPWTPKKGEYGLNSYMVDTTSGGAPSSTTPAQLGVFDMDNISAVDIEAWCWAFQQGGSFGQHTGRKLIDPCDGLARQNSEANQSQTGESDRGLSPFPWTLMATLADAHGLEVAGKQHGDAPEQAGSSMPGPSVVPYPTPPSLVPTPPPSGKVGHGFG